MKACWWECIIYTLCLETAPKWNPVWTEINAWTVKTWQDPHPPVSCLTLMTSALLQQRAISFVPTECPASISNGTEYESILERRAVAAFSFWVNTVTLLQTLLIIYLAVWGRGSREYCFTDWVISGILTQAGMCPTCELTAGSWISLQLQYSMIYHTGTWLI